MAVQNRRVCFSFAAYAKIVIDHLKNCEIPVLEGLSDSEFSSIESSFAFRFPPDLRAILREGLPVGTGFPNWRSSSRQQLQILINLPISGLCNEISKGNFWHESWGLKPNNFTETLTLAKRFLQNVPILVPIYKHCYIPSLPNLAGNPVIFVRGKDFRYSGFDVSGFFQTEEFRPKRGVPRPIRYAPDEKNGKSEILSPAWAAKVARRIEFWSELVDECGTCEGSESRTWWEVTCGDTCRDGFFEEMVWKLREGGWKEEEVMEMMMMDGGDVLETRVAVGPMDRQGMIWHVRLLGLALRNAGWGKDDVDYALGFQEIGK
ncbi:uncharacterized protein LOC143875784 [Tasmannia lanceolata]|uniref:uncharacterized protein LOC143875784 n=1 Tax=Tasmannia lanceolata TaxID=3420 RepID=UPI0040641DC8